MFHRLALAGITGLVAAVAFPGAAHAQGGRVYGRAPALRRLITFSGNDQNRAFIGVVVTSSGTARDTLGILVRNVFDGGPAEKAGIEEGNRIASINGVSLRVAPADAADPEMSALMPRRLTRELAKVKPGDEVDLRVHDGAQTRAVRIRTVASDSLDGFTLYDRNAGTRASLGITVGAFGNRRDTLGVLIAGVEDDGPAAKAGIEEGARLSALNGIDLRVPREDAGDDVASAARMRRFQRELAKAKPGDEVTLRVYSGGRSRDVKLKAVASSSLGQRWGMFMGGGAAETVIPPIPPVPPIPPDLHDRIQDALKRLMPHIESAPSGKVTM